MKKRRILPLAAAVAMLCACNSNDVPAPVADTLTDVPVTVVAGVDEGTTRAGMTTANLTTLGLSIHNPNSSKYSYTNVKYEKSGTAFVASGGQTIPFWQNKTQEVTVTAYSPYAENWSGEFAVRTDQSTADAAKASDLLWAQDNVQPDAATQTGLITYHSEALHINLQHKMSKLVVNLRYLNEVPQNVTARSLTVKYLAAGCTVDTETGTVTPLDASPATGAFTEATAAQGYTDCFEAIFPPQQMAFKLVILLDNGQDYIYHNPAFAFLSGTAYTLNLAVGKDKVLIADEGITANDWDTVAGGKLETDDKQ